MSRKDIDIEVISKLSKAVTGIILLLVVLMGVVSATLMIGPSRLSGLTQKSVSRKAEIQVSVNAPDNLWRAPDISSVSEDESGREIKYGFQLITHTSEYLGPKGAVKNISNGMNCQNCHLEGGTKPFGNNYSAVASTYPKFRPRSGTKETIEKRINDCFERSLNGTALEEDSREMKAIVAYINWLGKDVPKGKAPKGAGLVELPFLDEPASAIRGKQLYIEKCTTCHGENGTGIMNSKGSEWIYPPLWGNQSYNVGAGLYRLSRFAGYIKTNMPLGATHSQPLLTDEEAWHIAAYVNSLERPKLDLSKDWPDISKKPVDHPFGPYEDGFDENQHKYGPFKPIHDQRKSLGR